MTLHDYEERFFWKKIYHACIRAGRAGHQACLEADFAIFELRKTPVVKPAKLG